MSRFVWPLHNEKGDIRVMYLVSVDNSPKHSPSLMSSAVHAIEEFPWRELVPQKQCLLPTTARTVWYKGIFPLTLSSISRLLLMRYLFKQTVISIHVSHLLWNTQLKHLRGFLSEAMIMTLVAIYLAKLAVTRAVWKNAKGSEANLVAKWPLPTQMPLVF